MKTTTLLALCGLSAAPALGCLQVHCAVSYCATSIDDGLKYATDKLNSLQVSGKGFVGRDGTGWNSDPTFRPLGGCTSSCPAGNQFLEGDMVVWRGLDDGLGIRKGFEDKQYSFPGPTGSGHLGPCTLAQTVDC